MVIANYGMTFVLLESTPIQVRIDQLVMTDFEIIHGIYFGTLTWNSIITKSINNIY